MAVAYNEYQSWARDNFELDKLENYKVSKLVYQDCDVPSLFQAVAGAS